MTRPPPPRTVSDTVARALAEDVGPGDVSLAAVPEGAAGRAILVPQAAGVLCGRPFAEEVFRHVGGGTAVRWHRAEGDTLAPDEPVAELSGPARELLTGERSALNLLQTLSGTATATAELVNRVADLGVRLVDTRKTIPGLRAAQKYAVRVGGGHNHRHGLFDGVLLKENHLAWAGGLEAAVAAARDSAPHTLRVEVEVEDRSEMHRALAAGADALLLDNFPPAELATAVAERPAGVFLEASGNIDADTIRTVAETGVDAVSVGALTRDMMAVDLSLRYARP